MPYEVMEEEGLTKIPDLKTAQWIFTLKTNPNDADLKTKLMEELKRLEAGPLYEYVCKELKWSTDAKLLNTFKEANKKTLATLDAAIEDAKENHGESEVREALLKKAEHLAQIGDKEATIEAVRQTNEKTVGLGNRMDLVFLNIRVGLFFTDHAIIKANIAKAHQMLEEGGDWDRRNRLKVYEGLYMMSVRDFTAAAKLFLDAVSTFTSYELMEYVRFVEYAVIISVLALDRSELHKEVIKGSEILEVLHQLPDAKNYLFSLYNCQYAEFFQVISRFNRKLYQISSFLDPAGAGQGGAAYEGRPLHVPSLQVLRARGQDQGVRAAAGVLQQPHPQVHGRGFRRDGGVHRRGALQVHCRGQAPRQD